MQDSKTNELETQIELIQEKYQDSKNQLKRLKGKLEMKEESERMENQQREEAANLKMREYLEEIKSLKQ